MGNKIFYGIIAIVIVGFAAVFIFMNSASDNPEDGYYPYTDLESEQLSGATIDKLEDENYHYNKTLDETKEIIDAGEGEFVYFWSPTCMHCAAATPFLMDAFEQTGEEVTQLNVLEYEQAWTDYAIEATPTLIYFENGEEVDRFTGNPGNADEYAAFINTMTGAE
ncbi:thioredoxin family protein [Salinicoccus hispanicus]|uniref:Thioredoxin n=1 Tax=Salinicoccus hispanicus TaxID=157225 RepID=A0A6N8TXD7_9STAP|nr:thioredoxin family protein [Salinicoccus hispanicus]MXQ50584.1 thioredoxin [Salinicoccus hispanicus]